MVHREQPCSQSTIITIFVINRVILNNVFTDSHRLSSTRGTGLEEVTYYCVPLKCGITVTNSVSQN